MKKRCILSAFLFLIIFYIFNIKSYCKNIVVVIDPGHGGEALGGNIEDRAEREINLITAKSMYDRLSLYEGVDVYLTRENNEDKELSRKQRFDFAKEHDADFLISIHYNMSENHTLFGTEVWVPSTGPLYKKGYQLANIEIQGLTSLGLYNRGIKCKLGKDGGEYYGILKYARDYNIPAIIVEHCHLDEERDSNFWNEESYKKFGEIDADSVAKFYKLSSIALGIDNSNYELIDVNDDNIIHSQDTTNPDICNIELISNDIENGYSSVKLTASDSDSGINYYSYSTDNGKTFTINEIYDENNNIIDIPLIEGQETSLVFRVYNKYEGYTDSNIITLPMIPVIEDNTEDNDNEKQEKKYLDKDIVQIKSDKTTDVINTDIILISIGCMFFFLILISIYISFRIRKLKRKRKRK